MRWVMSLVAVGAIAGCQPAPAAAPPPAPTAAPMVFAPVPVFGAVSAVWVSEPEWQKLYRVGEDAAAKPYGKALGYYVTVDGRTYMVHWDYAEKVRALKVGETVNLHPSAYEACVKPAEGEEAPPCRRLMKLYRNDRPIDPIETL